MAYPCFGPLRHRWRRRPGQPGHPQRGLGRAPRTVRPPPSATTNPRAVLDQPTPTRTTEHLTIELSLSRHGARCWHYCRSVSPCLSPNPPCDSHRNGLSTVPVVRQFVGSRDWGSCCRGSGTGLPESLKYGVVRPPPP